MQYAVLIQHTDKGTLSATAPDFPGMTVQRNSFDNCLQAIEAEIKATLSAQAIKNLEAMQSNRMTVPITIPTPIEEHQKKLNQKNSIWGFIDINTEPYLEYTNDKRSITMPFFVYDEIERKGKKPSTYLTDMAIRDLWGKQSN